MPDLFKSTVPPAPAPAGQDARILSGLRNRLFDTSRRNRLLYYRPNRRFVELTTASMPLNGQRVAPERLLTYPAFARQLSSMKDLHLEKLLHFDDHPYLQGQLNTVRLQAESDEREYGFSQLRLVITFIHWHHGKGDTQERVQSPLLLLPVKLQRSKGIPRDPFTLMPTDTTAVINPVLAHWWQELYGISLPESIALDKTRPEELFLVLQQKIAAAQPGILLHYRDQPPIETLRHTALQTRERYQQGRRSPATADTVAEAGALHWEMDACNLVLGNFNYKKMSLVSDYHQVADRGIMHPVFQTLFSTAPRGPAPAPVPHTPRDWYHVIAADPTQTNAILHGRNGHSYIIQGPPGTGKSQTITNLVADYLARGKTVLFVCEKRAALDVVYHRLQQNGLAELCCYIHDSQADKKDFIKDLKTVYDDFLRHKMDLTHITLRRKIAQEHLQRQLQLLENYHARQRSTHAAAGIPTRQLISTLLRLQEHIPAIETGQADLPSYRHWLASGDTLQALSQALEQNGAHPALARHPFRNLGKALVQSEQPLTLMENISGLVQNTMAHIAGIIARYHIPPDYTEKLTDLITLVKHAAVLEPLATSHNLQLVNKDSKAARRFEKAWRQHRRLQKARKQAAAANQHWQHRLSPDEVQRAIAVASKHEGRFFRFLSRDWRQLKKQLQGAYDFSAHPLPPAFSAILQQLQQEYEAEALAQQHRYALQEQYGTDNIRTLHTALEALRRRQDDAPTAYLLQHPAAAGLVSQLGRLNHHLHELELRLQQCLYDYEHKSLRQAQEELDAIIRQAASLRPLLPALRAFAEVPAPLQDLVRQQALSAPQTEAALAQATLQQLFNEHPDFAAATDHDLQQAVKEIAHTYQHLLQLNSDYIRARQRQQFLQHYTLSHTAASQLDTAQKQQKKIYAEGRRLLEHEMSKTMRFKSIREMASLESGAVLKDIKPVWLMSPLSVSDSLPLDTALFDVVIFDEASQIPLEEGIPALFRAAQTIIVGDEKQMPPASFFHAGHTDPDDLDAPENGNGEALPGMDAESLLAQGARQLHSTMLCWHYRSRHESLISYSNHAFYGAALLTVPDRSVPQPHPAATEIPEPGAGAQTAQQLLQGGISFHYLPNSIYEERSNLQEAQYIACMVKQLLLDAVQDSIGIVAFSQEQQGAINAAIATLAAEDRAFEAALENARNRTTAGQYNGLFVKNLENVQGDERDIIIISICYGHNRQGKMGMNFGPINRQGGEKRLNVIFSRARKHMAVVSSIRHSHITNTHNAGARYFRLFLHYAEMAGAGRMQEAQQLLDSLPPPGKKAPSRSTASGNITTQQVKAALQAAGYTVDEAVGQSSFRCTLAVKRQAADTHYCLGILVDDEQHYAQNNLVEQYYQRPAVLQSFGWRIAGVYAKDWLADRHKVLSRLLALLQDKH
ncbi:AAA domain-containing protein [Chitinophaga japonensis]|uniref:AAA domain-containing protein n=1 Tax=Chitinophaga japonensis TaxID=104662 RepID=A0A562STQ9_CHIJA|nr:AAA domain-containing protein [Chitinophaga japonensis]TWI84493.1 AAA domain-containing protein [Chitinophaga japonensis]